MMAVGTYVIPAYLDVLNALIQLLMAVISATMDSIYIQRVSNA